MLKDAPDGPRPGEPMCREPPRPETMSQVKLRAVGWAQATCSSLSTPISAGVQSPRALSLIP
jgi:hypothetical protein